MADAKEYTVSKALHELNEEVTYVDGADLVYRSENDLRMKTDKFVSSHYANRRYLVATQTGMQEKSAAAEWLKWESRSVVKNFTYRPGAQQITDDHYYNLWEPWPYTPTKDAN